MFSEHDVSEVALSKELNHSGGVGFWSWDIQRDCAQADPVSALLFNLSPAQSKQGVPLSVVLKAIHPDDLDRLSAVIFDRVRLGGAYTAEYRVVSVAGNVRWLFTRGHFYLDEDGQPTHGRGVVVDITDTKANSQSFVRYDEQAIIDPVNRAADLSLSIYHELAKIGDTKLLMMIEIILIDLGKMIAADQNRRLDRGLH